MKRFGHFIKEQRLKLGLLQEDIEGFQQTYISDIELGRGYPARRETIAKLAAALKLDTSKYSIDWLWTYAQFDCEPDEYFARPAATAAPAAPGTRPALPPLLSHDAPAAYHAQPTTDIQVGMPPAQVIALLGAPTQILRFGPRERWHYHAAHLDILFDHDAVCDVLFR